VGVGGEERLVGVKPPFLPIPTPPPALLKLQHVPVNHIIGVPEVFVSCEGIRRWRRRIGARP